MLSLMSKTQRPDLLKKGVVEKLSCKKNCPEEGGPPPLGQGSGPPVDDGPEASVHSRARPPRPVPSHRIPRTLMALGATGLPREGAEKEGDYSNTP